MFGCGRESPSSGTVNRVDDLGDVAGPGETPMSELLSRSDPLGLRDLLRRLARLGNSRWSRESFELPPPKSASVVHIVVSHRNYTQP